MTACLGETPIMLSPRERLLRNLDWNLLYTFLVIVEESSITGAAGKLALSQPSVSRLIDRLAARGVRAVRSCEPDDIALQILFGLAIGLLLATQCEGGVPLLLIVAGLWMTFTGRSVLLARISLMGGISMLAFINQSVATIAPLLLLPFWQHLPKIKTMPRMKHLFYLFYPAHLYALAGISLALQ